MQPKMVLLIGLGVLLLLILTSCAKYFEEPYLGQLETATPEDIHVLVNLEWAEVPDSCLNSAEQKVEYMRLHNYTAQVIVIRPYKDPDMTHAVALQGGTVYDNCYLSCMPFDYRYLEFYGKRVAWTERTHQ